MMNKKILIVGGGYIGQKLARAFDAPLCLDRINTYEDIGKLVKQFKPQIVINGIGHVGKNNVDDCEKAIDKTLSGNTFIPIMMGEAALRHGFKLVHISSGCIYHFNYKNQPPIPETRNPDYYDLFYSRTKIYAEDALMRLAKKGVNVLITRIRVPLDQEPHPKNLLTKLIKYQRVIDVPNSVTYIPDYIRALQHLLKKDAQGIFNVMAKGALYYPDMMKLYQNFNPDFHFDIIKLKTLQLNRTSLIMSVRKLEQTGFKVRTIKEILPECVKHYTQSL